MARSESVGDRAGVQFAQALEHGAFAVRRVDFLAGLELDFADVQDVAGALVQQLDDLRVELVDGLAMFRNVHLNAKCGVRSAQRIRRR